MCVGYCLWLLRYVFMKMRSNTLTLLLYGYRWKTHTHTTIYPTKKRLTLEAEACGPDFVPRRVRDEVERGGSRQDPQQRWLLQSWLEPCGKCIRNGGSYDYVEKKHIVHIQFICTIRFSSWLEISRWPQRSRSYLSIDLPVFNSVLVFCFSLLNVKRSSSHSRRAENTELPFPLGSKTRSLSVRNFISDMVVLFN
jgi:hypothetical protein